MYNQAAGISPGKEGWEYVKLDKPDSYFKSLLSCFYNYYIDDRHHRCGRCCEDCDAKR